MKVHVLAAVALAVFASPALAVELVTPADLGRDMFDAKPIKSTDAKGRVSEMTFAPGGKLSRKTASGRVSEGTWRLSDEGFCMKLANAKREGCYLVVRGEGGKLTALKQSGQPFTWSR
jgi:hypothetical protein